MIIGHHNRWVLSTIFRQGLEVLFNSDLFLFVFLPITYALFLLSAKFSPIAARLVLVIASCTFYAAWRLDFLPLLLASAAFNYCCGILINRLHLRSSQLTNVALAGGAIANLALLSYYKYADFFLTTIGYNSVFSSLILPLGISFYTFTQIAYLVDVRRAPNNLVRDPIRYLLFVTIFPHLIAGPILHHAEMIPQFDFDKDDRRLEDSVVGLAIFVIGLFKKTILADGVQPFIGMAFGAHQPGIIDAWTGALAFSLQLYFDFSGYSDMAIGLARMFGVRFPLNFDSPYKATSIIDFWRRWHMTLSHFLRDYLYIPLGGNRSGLGHLPNLMTTMVLGGLWHGAGWTFVAWGALHGAYLITNHLWRSFRQQLNLSGDSIASRATSRVFTFICVVIAWVLFRAENIDQALRVYKGMFGITNNGHIFSCSDALGHICTAGVPVSIWWIGCLTIVAMTAPNTQQIMGAWKPVLGPEPKALRYAELSFRPTLLWAAVLATMFAISIVWLHPDSPFLYYQF